MKNTLLANSRAGENCNGSITSQGHNLSDDDKCAFIQTGDMNNTPAGLDPGGLKNKRRPDPDHALLATSPAVDAIPVSPVNDCTDVAGKRVDTDQRGVTRPQGPTCDIGALELFPSFVPFAALSARVEIEHDDAFEVRATFTLGAGSNGIAPLTEDVKLQVGTFSTVIPAGSFTQEGGGQFKFEGVIAGATLEMEIEDCGEGASSSRRRERART